MEDKLKQEALENITEGRTRLPMVALRGKVLFPGVNASFDVGRQMSLAAIDYASNNNTDVFVAAQKDVNVDNPSRDDIYNVGVVCRIRQILKMPGNNARVNVQVAYRARIYDYVENARFLEVDAERMYMDDEPSVEVEAAFRSVKAAYKEYVSSSKTEKDVSSVVEGITEAEEFTNVATYHMSFKNNEKQGILENNSLIDRLVTIEGLLGYELEIAALEKKIAARVRQNIDKSQKEFYLREQLRAIHAELGDDEQENERLRQAILDKKMPPEVEEKALKELTRLDRMSSASAEYTTTRNYIDWVLDLPFNEATTDTDDINEAAKILNEDHYGLEKVKERIIEYLAVLKLTKCIRGPILCFVGPPGVGKTSVAKSIARALGRKFVRMSLGGVGDESEIRGHRRTYVGAIPGRVMYAMKEAGVVNPVFLLDEIDKLARDFRSDPSAALLEVLDPEQNSTFRDRFMEIPYDLSKVLFITTANTMDTIPAPLRDRMEIIRLSGYTQEEKIQIAKRYLIPKQTAANGLSEGNLQIDDNALSAIISGYTMEAGVRTLEREIGGLCRKIATKLAAEPNLERQVVTDKNIEEYLGAKRYFREEALKEDEVGAVTGLAWTAYGGTTLTVECMLMRGKGEIILTGQLGDVMKESARAAISFIRSHADKYGIDDKKFTENDIHLHVPEGATPKDGPSAGITMATAILSAFTERKAKKSVAMTGEITLRGKVLPIGGLKEKSLAAHRLGIRDIIIPKANLKDLEEIPEDIRKEITFHPVEDVREVFEIAII